MDRFEIGDYVKIIDSSRTHATHETWAEEHIAPPFQWAKGKKPEPGRIYKISIIGAANKKKTGYDCLYGISDDFGNIFIMNENGFEKVTADCMELYSLLTELHMYFDFTEPLVPGETIRFEDPKKVNVVFDKIKQVLNLP